MQHYIFFLVYSIFDKHLFTINTTNDCNCLDVCTEIRFKHNVVYTHRNLTKKAKNPKKRLKYLINFGILNIIFFLIVFIYLDILTNQLSFCTTKEIYGVYKELP